MAPGKSALGGENKRLKQSTLFGALGMSQADGPRPKGTPAAATRGAIGSPRAARANVQALRERPSPHGPHVPEQSGKVTFKPSAADTSTAAGGPEVAATLRKDISTHAQALGFRRAGAGGQMTHVATVAPSAAPPPPLPLDKDQRAVVEADEKLVVVHAGPGSGKTRTLVARAVHLIRRRSVHGPRILALTFSAKSRAELKARLTRALAPEEAAPMVHTFHSACLDLLRRHDAEAEEVLGIPRRFKVADRSARDHALKRALEECQGQSGEARPAWARECLERWRNEEAIVAACNDVSDQAARRDLGAALRSHVGIVAGDDEQCESARAAHASLDGKQRCALAEAYTETLRSQGLLDYDDLQRAALALLRARQDVAAGWCDEVLVDELQDSSAEQCLLCAVLARAGKGVTAVGDPDQCIYGWRFACPEGARALSLLADREARVLWLRTNYRSTQTIVDTANAVLASHDGQAARRRSGHRQDASGTGAEVKGHQSRCVSARGEGARVRLVRCETREAEGRAVCAALIGAIADGHSPGDTAVLVRVRRDVEWAASVVRACGLPVTGVGTTMLRGPSQLGTLGENPRVKDAVAVLVLASRNKHAGRTSLARALSLCRGVGPKTVEALVAASCQGPRGMGRGDEDDVAWGAVQGAACNDGKASVRVTPGGRTSLKALVRAVANIRASAERGDSLAHIIGLVTSFLESAVRGGSGAAQRGRGACAVWKTAKGWAGAGPEAAAPARGPSGGDSGWDAADPPEGIPLTGAKAVGAQPLEHLASMAQDFDDAEAAPDAIRGESAPAAAAVTRIDRFLALVGAIPAATATTGLSPSGHAGTGSSHRGGSVHVLTVHAAKGLEWPVVVVAGVGDGSFPHVLSARSHEAVAEERRLLFVAVTRAASHLVLTYTGRPSPFIVRLPEDAVDVIESRGDDGGPNSRGEGTEGGAERATGGGRPGWGGAHPMSFASEAAAFCAFEWPGAHTPCGTVHTAGSQTYSGHNSAPPTCIAHGSVGALFEHRRAGGFCTAADLLSGTDDVPGDSGKRKCGCSSVGDGARQRNRNMYSEVACARRGADGAPHHPAAAAMIAVDSYRNPMLGCHNASSQGPLVEFSRRTLHEG